MNLKIANHLELLVPGAGLEPARGHTPRDFKSLASTRSATQAGELGLLAATLYGRIPVPAIARLGWRWQRLAEAEPLQLF